MARLPTSRLLGPGDDLAPQYLLKFSGKDASAASSLFDAVVPFISSVEWEDDEDMASMLTIVLVNKSRDQYGAASDFRAILENKAFQEGNFIDVWLGYHNTHFYKGRVEIVKWLPNFPENGPITFQIKAYDGRHKMMKANQFKVKQSGKSRKRKTFYRGLTDDLIVRKIAAKYGYAAVTDTPEIKRTSTKKNPLVRVQPSDMSDWAFLQKLARINRFDLTVEYEQSSKQHTVFFRKRVDAGSAVYRFEYSQGAGSLLSAQPDFSIQDQPTDVEVLYFDRKQRRIERTIISDSNTAEIVKLTSASPTDLSVKKEIGRGASVRFTAFGQQIEAFANKPFRSKNEATTFVTNWLKERDDDFLILRGKVVGVEDLESRQIHEVAGLSKRIDGFYRFTQVKHVKKPEGIYYCEFLAHKVLTEPLTRRKKTTKVQTQAKPQQAG